MRLASGPTTPSMHHRQPMVVGMCAASWRNWKCGEGHAYRSYSSMGWRSPHVWGVLLLSWVSAVASIRRTTAFQAPFGGGVSIRPLAASHS